jgi:hypothetical protein
MAVVTTTPKNIRFLPGALVRQRVAGEALALGDSVSLGTDKKVRKTANASSKFYGVVVAGDQKQSSVAAGESVAVVVFGPVTGFSSLPTGKVIWLSATAGKFDDATGTQAAGYAESDTELFVMPGVTTVGSS